MRVGRENECDRPLIDSREAALRFAEECGLAATPEHCLLLLLNSKCLLLSTERLPASALAPLDGERFLHAARTAAASGFLLLGYSQDELSSRLRRQLSKTALTCREFGVEFIDYLQISGSVARSLMWDSAHPPARNPWSND
jgi:hypothetical protein